MRSLGERWSLLRKLVALQCGPGAAVLPPEVTRIHVDFARNMKGGHMGARKFWREYLPRLKYHNPSVPMIVNRHDQAGIPPTMTIYLRNSPSPSSSSSSPTAAAADTPQPSSSRTNLSKAQPPAPGERIVHINMQEKHSSHILEFFMAETRAVALKPTAEEIAEMQSLEAQRKQADVDRERMRLLRVEKKKEEDMLKRARAAGGMAEQEEA